MNADQMIRFVDILLDAKRPAIVYHPDAKSTALLVARMMPHRRLVLIEEKYMASGMVAAMDLAKMYGNWKPNGKLAGLKADAIIIEETAYMPRRFFIFLRAYNAIRKFFIRILRFFL